jgi:hypothetical protein
MAAKKETHAAVTFMSRTRCRLWVQLKRQRIFGGGSSTCFDHAASSSSFTPTVVHLYATIFVLDRKILRPAPFSACFFISTLFLPVVIA